MINKLQKYHYPIIVFGIAFILVGVGLVGSAFGAHPTSINHTAIDNELDHTSDYTGFTGSYSVFWMIFLLVILAGFMVAMFAYREDRETIFFSLGALIIALIITLIFTSPLDFDLQETKKTYTVIGDDVQALTATATIQTNQIILIPADSDMRLIVSLFFTGLTLFLGLYSMYIITNYHEGKKLNSGRG